MKDRGLYDRRRFLWLMFGLRLIQFLACSALAGWALWTWRTGEGGFPFTIVPLALLMIYFAWGVILEWRKPR